MLSSCPQRHTQRSTLPGARTSSSTQKYVMFQFISFYQSAVPTCDCVIVDCFQMGGMDIVLRRFADLTDHLQLHVSIISMVVKVPLGSLTELQVFNLFQPPK